MLGMYVYRVFQNVCYVRSSVVCSYTVELLLTQNVFFNENLSIIELEKILQL